MKFTKMHGCGNDFIVIDEHDGRVEIDATRTRALCDRRTGVGADGILVIGSPKGARWPRVIHNADGSRCVARYLLERYGGEALELDTKSGVVRARAIPRATPSSSTRRSSASSSPSTIPRRSIWRRSRPPRRRWPVRRTSRRRVGGGRRDHPPGARARGR